MDAFDPAMPGFDKLRYNVVGITSQADVSCSIEVLSNEGDDSARTATLDWILTLEHKDGNAGSTRRQKRVTCRFKKTGKKWRIVSFDPWTCSSRRRSRTLTVFALPVPRRRPRLSVRSLA